MLVQTLQGPAAVVLGGAGAATGGTSWGGICCVSAGKRVLFTTVLCVNFCHQLEKIFLRDLLTELHVDQEVQNQLWISFLGLKSNACFGEGNNICLCE